MNGLEPWSAHFEAIDGRGPRIFQRKRLSAQYAEADICSLVHAL